MLEHRDMRAVVRLFLVAVLALFAQFTWAQDAGSQKEQVQRQQTQPLNNAPVWRDVRGGENPYQTTQARGIETNVLVQTEGEIWRQIRNGPVTVYGGWLITIVAVLIALYYGLKGPIKLHAQPTGRVIERFTPWERIIHWATAISFVILAVSGIVILFGRYVLLPVFGYTLFSWLAVISKNLHNFVGPVFAVCTVLMFVTFVKNNIWRAHDWIWVKRLGGMFGKREHVPSGKFNAGEKMWFWFGVTLLGIIVSITGFILDFPNFAQGRVAMQQANVIHAVAAILFMAAFLGHLYMGTVGVEGAYESMRNGTVDETWAREHHEYWYKQVTGGRAQPAGATPSAAPASPMREGWKT
ncbi:MAG: formate dehydrogenase subunit gamma [Betaproteobacteria bacterium]|nr:formate dehydrogenase subunit gamma [Betaproteobacteria bacterium]